MNKSKIVKNVSLVLLGLMISAGIIYGTNLLLKAAETDTPFKVEAVIEICSKVNYSFCKDLPK